MLCYANVTFLNYASHSIGRCIDCLDDVLSKDEMGALVTEKGNLVILIRKSRLEIRQLLEIIKKLE